MESSFDKIDQRELSSSSISACPVQKGHCNSHVRAHRHEPRVILGVLPLLDPLFETADIAHRFGENVTNNVAGNTVGAHDEDELAIKKGDLILGQLQSMSYGFSESRRTLTTLRSFRALSNLIKEGRSRTS